MLACFRVPSLLCHGNSKSKCSITCGRYWFWFRFAFFWILKSGSFTRFSLSLHPLCSALRIANSPSSIVMDITFSRMEWTATENTFWNYHCGSNLSQKFPWIWRRKFDFDRWQTNELSGHNSAMKISTFSVPFYNRIKLLTHYSITCAQIYFQIEQNAHFSNLQLATKHIVISRAVSSSMYLEIIKIR